MTETNWPLTTPRLQVRPVEDADLEEIWAYRSLPDVRLWAGGSLEPEAFRDWFLKPADGSPRLVVLAEGRLVGDLMLVVQDAWAQREVVERAQATQALLGWAFHPDAGGRGLATEAVAELVRHAFEDLGLRRVMAECFTANEPSWRLMERLGMRREAHHVLDSLHRDRGWQDEYVYALLADEWPSPSTSS